MEIKKCSALTWRFFGLGPPQRDPGDPCRTRVLGTLKQKYCTNLHHWDGASDLQDRNRKIGFSQIVQMSFLFRRWPFLWLHPSILFYWGWNTKMKYTNGLRSEIEDQKFFIFITSIVNRGCCTLCNTTWEGCTPILTSESDWWGSS